MTALLAAEIRKLWTVRTTWVITALGWGIVALSTGVLLFTEQLSGPFTGTDVEVAGAVGQVGGTAIIVLVVALLAMTTEFRHGTIGRVLQVTPSRGTVLLAKLAAGVVYAVAFFATGLVIVAALLLVASGVRDVPLDVGRETATALWQGPVGLGLNAVLGVAVGALVRSQVVAITVTLVWLFVAESLVTTLAPAVGRWLPFQALNALFLTEEMVAAMPESAGTPLSPGVALVTFVLYVVVATSLAGMLLRTRDV